MENFFTLVIMLYVFSFENRLKNSKWRLLVTDKDLVKRSRDTEIIEKM